MSKEMLNEKTFANVEQYQPVVAPPPEPLLPEVLPPFEVLLVPPLLPLEPPEPDSPELPPSSSSSSPDPGPLQASAAAPITNQRRCLLIVIRAYITGSGGFRHAE